MRRLKVIYDIAPDSSEFLIFEENFILFFISVDADWNTGIAKGIRRRDDKDCSVLYCCCLETNAEGEGGTYWKGRM